MDKITKRDSNKIIFPWHIMGYLGIEQLFVKITMKQILLHWTKKNTISVGFTKKKVLHKYPFIQIGYISLLF